MLLGGQTTEFTRMNIYPFCPLHQIAAFHSLISQATPFADEACETNHSLGRTESCWKTPKRFFRTVCIHASHIMFEHVTMLCACHGRSPSIGPIGDAKQAMGEGKSGPVETGLTGPVTYTPLHSHTSLHTPSLIHLPCTPLHSRTSLLAMALLHASPTVVRC